MGIGLIENWLEQVNIANVISLVALLAVISLALVVRRKLRSIYDMAYQAQVTSEDRYRSGLDQRAELLETLSLTKSSQKTVNDRLESGFSTLSEKVDYLGKDENRLLSIENAISAHHSQLNQMDSLTQQVIELKEFSNRAEHDIADVELRRANLETDLHLYNDKLRLEIEELSARMTDLQSNLAELNKLRSEMSESLQQAAQKLQISQSHLNGRAPGSSLIIRKAQIEDKTNIENNDQSIQNDDPEQPATD